jgi:hypothetical protein
MPGTISDFESLAADLLKKGKKARAPAVIVGKSGVKHEFAFAIDPDAEKPEVVVDTELSVKEVDEVKVLKFYVKVYDVGPKRSILCVTPKLTEGAASLAKGYEISVVQDETPKNLIEKAARIVEAQA